ncbi:ABC transporter substrate-binding protein [Frankia sp. AgB1.9]|uniref:ABC transporter substrate-binding protein n=1 Tax=unclassified Frankia TaxID=2632575 RepID=UPI0019320F3D|nr:MULTISPECIES: ABC transporter substrate-binding protein [unclassified Frankia]MBL7492339.1 ABC transporter substrate-binding protein [Frankia sp. AgW1.1]MBL7551888.1 ABC transporter substrate-binding protein [Frankia sp. AgB1.9]MBL7625532.1 ABC transporter substrate-binding protein [Frankia sp. AgB1.8]
MKTLRRRRGAVPGTAAVLALVTGLAACGGGSSSSAAGSSGKPVQGGVISYAHVQEPPCVFGGWIQQAYISRNVLDGLVAEADDGSVVPWLATSWEKSADGLSYTFTLKPGVKFTDGTPLDAAAVAWNFDFWETPPDPTSGNSTAKVSLDPYYKGAKAIDATHVEIDLNKPYGEFLRLITQGYFGIQSPTAFKKEGLKKNCEQPIGSGAFTVAQWKHGEEIVLKRNPNYTSWPANAKHKGAAYVDEVDYKFVPDNVSRYASLGTGQSQVVYEVPTAQWKDAQSKYQTIKYITPGHPPSFFLDTTDGPFADKLVRQAFAYGADRKGAVEASFHGVIPYEGNPAVSQSTPGYNAQAAQDYPYDAAKANALLDQAGWVKGADGIRTKDGKPLTIRIPYGAGVILPQEATAALQILQQQWKQVGFDVKLIPLTQADLFAGKDSAPGTFDASPSYWTSPSPAILWIVYRPSTKAEPNGNNGSFFNDDQLSQVIQSANAEQDPAKSTPLYQQAQQIVQDNAAGVGFYTQYSLYAYSKNLHDFWLERSQGEPVFADAYYTK